jgi:hypothetical protein
MAVDAGNGHALSGDAFDDRSGQPGLAETGGSCQQQPASLAAERGTDRSVAVCSNSTISTSSPKARAASSTL